MKSQWQLRAKKAGLTQKTIAELTRRNENSVGRALGGTRLNPTAAGPYIAVILAWEAMDDRQRQKWLQAVARAARSEKRQKKPTAARKAPAKPATTPGRPGR